jgi:hypothetical protein
MKKLTPKIALAISAVVAVALLLVNTTSGVKAASEVKFYLSPSSASVSPNDTLTLSWREDSGSEPVNVATTHIYYPTSSLQLLSITPSAQFPLNSYSYGPGVINVHYQATFSPVTNDQLVATIKFKAIASSGNFNVTIDPVIGSSNSSLISSNSHSNILSAVYSGSYGISQPPPTPLPPEAGTTKPPPSTTPTGVSSGSGSTEQITLPDIQNQQTLVPGQTSTIDGSGNRRLDVILLWVAAAVVVLGAIFERRIKRRYRAFRGRETVADIVARTHSPNRHARETVAEIAARINRRRADTKGETIAELTSRMSRLVRKASAVYFIKLNR